MTELDFGFRLRSQTRLAGARILLSGSLPDSVSPADAEGARILGFVRGLVTEVFRQGGHVIHGSSPSLTPILLDEARRFQLSGGQKDCLVLAVSRYWSKSVDNVPLEQWRESAVVYETPECTGANARTDSLALLREWMVARADAMVVIGGKRWKAIPSRAGVPVEVTLALDQGLPVFLLGGFGGEVRHFIDADPSILDFLKNGLTVDVNRDLALSANGPNIVGTLCSHLARLPLVKGRSIEGSSFRILALDGGGIRGTYSAAALAAWEEQSGNSIIGHFDLIAGTSTGGILAIGLGMGISPREMLDFYTSEGPLIFPVTSFSSRMSHAARHLFRPKYSQTILLNALESAYYVGGRVRRLKDSAVRLVIPAYHAIAGASHVFRTPHHPDLTADAETEAAHAALATSAAPTFFTAAKIANMVSEASYFDGGVWANSPVLAAIVEATCFLQVPLERIDVLSVGTTEEPFTVRGHTRAGAVRWYWKGLDLLLKVQQEAALKFARQLAGAPRFLRVNAITGANQYKMDDARRIGELAALGERSALEADTLSQVKSRFLNGVHVVPWRDALPMASTH